VNKQYQLWITRFDTLKDTGIETIRQQIEEMAVKPLFSVIMPVYNPDLEIFYEAVQSVKNQLYPHWELCIADDASFDPKVQEVIKSFAQNDTRIRYIIRGKNGHISAASNSALDLATGDFIALLDQDDKLHPLALFRFAQTINENPDCEIIYSDEDKITRSGKRVDPYFKSDFDYELLLNHNMVIHLGVYKLSTVRKAGGFRIGFEGSQDYDLNLRIIDQIDHNQIYHIPYVLYHWRISKTSAAGNINIKPYAAKAAVRAIDEHFERNKIDAVVDYNSDLAIYQPRYLLPEPPPSVAIVIFARTLSDKGIRCVDSLLTNTCYENFSIKVCLGNPIEDLGDGRIDKWNQNPRLSIIRENDLINRTAVINHIIRGSSADFICIINEGASGFTPDWLRKMIGQALQKGIGAVGTKLIRPDGNIYSNGIVLGINGLATHLFRNKPKDDPGYIYWAMLQKGYSALSSSCMIFKKSTFQEVGGFDEQLIEVDNADVDFCLRLREKQLRNVLIPSIVLDIQQNDLLNLPLEEVDQQEIIDELDYMKTRWASWITNDPSFNPNLTQTDKGEITINLSPRAVVD
jgi:glycosyltransferase involved in cell wall biosynthesis